LDPPAELPSTNRPRSLDVAAQPKRSAHAALGLAINCAQQYHAVAGQRTHGTTFRAPEVTPQVATPGAESAVYDCFVWFVDVKKRFLTFLAFFFIFQTFFYLKKRWQSSEWQAD